MDSTTGQQLAVAGLALIAVGILIRAYVRDNQEAKDLKNSLKVARQLNEAKKEAAQAKSK